MNVIAVLMVSALLQASAAPDAIVHDAVVNAPVNQVWDAFTTKDGIESWMAATGDVDPRVGGKMRVTHRKGADLDGETAIHQTILSVDPQRMLSFRTVKSPEDFPFAATIGRTWTVIYFEAIDANRTRVTAKMLGYGSDPELQKMRAFFEVGNKATLDALIKRFAR